jgi:hypothetical protein
MEKIPSYAWILWKTLLVSQMVQEIRHMHGKGMPSLVNIYINVRLAKKHIMV